MASWCYRIRLVENFPAVCQRERYFLVHGVCSDVLDADFRFSRLEEARIFDAIEMFIIPSATCFSSSARTSSSLLPS